MRFFFLLLFILNLIFHSNAQDYKVSSSSIKHTINLNDYVDTWKFSIQSLEMIKPGGNSYNNFLLGEKKRAIFKYPRKPSLFHSRLFNNYPEFLIENGFEGNLYNNKIPNDNTLAISNDNIIIAGINSSFIIYKLNEDSLLLRTTLNSITSTFTNLLFVKKYDPKFIYDHEEDRFIMVFLVGNKPINSHVCVAYSTTNNPLDDWNVYMLKGDALNSGHWTDYPAISLTKDDLFITGNLLLVL